MSKYVYKSAPAQHHKDRVSAVAVLDALATGYYAGFWDVTEPGGAFSIANAVPAHDGDKVHRMPQLLPTGSGSELTIWDQTTGLVQSEMDYRRRYLTQSHRTFPQKPIVFYPDGFFQQPNAFNNMFEVHGDMGIPALEVLKEYTVALAGVKMLHELGFPQSFIDAFDAAGRSSFPVPIEPGTLVIVTYLAAGHDMPGDPAAPPVTEVYVNGILLDTSAVASTDPIDPAVGIDHQSFLNMFAYPCWGTQKIFCCTRKFTALEAAGVHQAFKDSMGVYS